MILREIFTKPVDRPIEGVIKADDEAQLKTEVEEYVLTNEIEKRLNDFLTAYNNYHNSNGVWISGFFGSGKSHLLKMLAYLLENENIDGDNILDLFVPKVQHDPLLKAELTKAVSIPSQSILFNIDQKADVISKTELDALLSVFVKVFDEACGYFGKQAYIAQFERELDQEGLFVEFKQAFQQHSKKDWTVGRERVLRFSKNIDQAYNQVTKNNVADVLKTYRDDYKLSIEDFAEKVDTYIKTKGPKFRLNFFVDEVGQYIADNVKLMTNLQTVAESLNTKCNGRAWIIVTAQEDMATVVGEMGKQQSNDFSKIQGRFATKMKLTSQDVAEVIQKRLLMKNDNGERILKIMFDEQRNNFKTLFDFADGSLTFKNFQNKGHFIYSYPFIPYQFSLFQQAIQNLSKHNAFEGQHSSVGERSMLGVFQQVAVKIAEHKPGQLATFDLMFEGIRTALKGQIQSSILLAENELNDPFAVQVLKALFLVKYVKGFKSTIRNIQILMTSEFDQDLPALKSKLEEALNKLEQQTYIQRNGDEYGYLTDEEKDVEQEIKNMDIDTSSLQDVLKGILFDKIIRKRKIRYSQNGQDYDYGKKIDDRLFGRDQELSINIITSFHEHAFNEVQLTMKSMGGQELLVVLPADDRAMKDLILHQQTAKYIRQNYSITQQDSVRRILEDKTRRNADREKEIVQRLESALGGATFYVNGTVLDIQNTNPQTRTEQGFESLIAQAYPHLQMLPTTPFLETDLAGIINEQNNSLFTTEAIGLTEAEQEMLATIQRKTTAGVRTTFKFILDTFEKRPYGWYYAANLCILAKLCVRSKVEVSLNGSTLTKATLESDLRNTNNQGSLIVTPCQTFTPSQVRQLKDFYDEFFDVPPSTTDGKALGLETIEKLKEVLKELENYQQQESQYPFLSQLNDIRSHVDTLTKKNYAWLLTDLPQVSDDILDLKDDVLAPIRNFMKGSQKEIYDNATQFLNTESANLSYVDAQKEKSIRDALADPNCYKGTGIQSIKDTVEELKVDIQTQVTSAQATAVKGIEEMKNKVLNDASYAGLMEHQQQQVQGRFDGAITNIKNRNIIGVINDGLRRFKTETYSDILRQMTGWANANTTTYPNPGEGQKPEVVAEPPITKEIVVKGSIDVSIDKLFLESEADVEQYIEAVKKAYLTQINSGKRIQI